MPENLKGLAAEDLCPATVVVTIDGTKDKLLEETLLKSIKDQDILFNTKLMESYYPLCTQGVMVKFQALKLTSGSYVYSYTLEVYSFKAEAKTFTSSKTVDFATYYDISGLAFIGSLSSMQKSMEESIKNIFQLFLLDWRRSH